MQAKLRPLVAAVCLIGGTTALRAQIVRVALPHLSDRADMIVQAKVSRTDHDEFVRRVSFTVESTIKGQLPEFVTLTEPNSRACGEALHGLAIGTTCLLFLENGASGPRLAMGSPQSLVTDPDVQDHMRGAISVRTPSETLSLLSGALSSRSASVRQSAALSLSLMRDLSRASAVHRRQIAAALATSLGIDDLVGLSLIRVAARLNLGEAVDVLVPHYLSGRSPALENVLLETIPTIDSQRALALVSARTPEDIRGQIRAIEILSRFGNGRATTYLRQLEGSRSPVVSRMAREALTEGPVRKRFRSILRDGR